MLTTEQMWDAVKRGAAVLDKRFGPEWADRIDVQDLDMRDDARCILGQLTATSYYALVEDLSGVSWLSGLSDRWQESRGFVLLGDQSLDDAPEWVTLCRLWLFVIAGEPAQGIRLA